MTTFLTGSSGFLGRYLAQGLLDEGEDVVLLIRGHSHEHAEDRARAALNWMGGGADRLIGSRVTVVRGDLDRPGLGLSTPDRGLVVERCDAFLHCGASVRFDLPLAEARAVNVEGTRAVLHLARERRHCGGLKRIDHVSTAYVAGDRSDLVREGELASRVVHRNSYEQTKYEAELLVREAQADLPIAVFRPSIVVGESDFGRTSNFNVLYWPLRAYAQGYWRTLPGRRATPLDIVPVDFVRDALLALRRDPATCGRTFHLAAGPEGTMSVGDLLLLIEEFFPDRRGVRVVNPTWWMSGVHPLLERMTFGRLRRFLQSFALYIPYAMGNPRFDNTIMRRHLESTGIAAPHVKTYFGRLVEFCIATEWGRREPGADIETPARTQTGS